MVLAQGQGDGADPFRQGDIGQVDNLADFKKEYPLFALLNPSTDQQGQLYLVCLAAR